MRFVRNCLSDPSLHLLAIALIMIYLAFGEQSTFETGRGRRAAGLLPEVSRPSLPGEALRLRAPSEGRQRPALSRSKGDMVTDRVGSLCAPRIGLSQGPIFDSTGEEPSSIAWR